jgi:hypothetical protein
MNKSITPRARIPGKPGNDGILLLAGRVSRGDKPLDGFFRKQPGAI